jgi:hemolysin activation/secretion protein
MRLISPNDLDAMTEKLTTKPTLKLLPQVLIFSVYSAAIVLQPALAQNSFGAGSLLQQAEPRLVPLPLPSVTGLQIDPILTPGFPRSAPFWVQRIEFSGNTVFSTPTLQALVAEAQGQQLTLPQVGEMASRITSFYRSQGYPLARAIIPAQTIMNGVLRIEVIEASYGKISLDNKSAVADSLIASALAHLISGQVIDQVTLDKGLLQISDIPGVLVDATLQSGSQIGTSDLILTLKSGQAVTGNAVIDNNGSSLTGRARVGVTVNMLNPLQHGDVLSISGLSSEGGMKYSRASYDSLMKGQGFRIGGSYSSLKYDMDVTSGTAEVKSLWAKQTLQRGRASNVFAQLQLDQLKLRDHAGVALTDRHLSNLTASLVGDFQDTFFDGAVNSWSVSWTSGKLGFDDDAAALANASTTNTQGHFSKTNANFTHQQNFNANSAIYLAVSGQWASGNLDSSQKMLIGGPTSVRAYDVGVISADESYLTVAEWRQELGTSFGGQLQAVAFIDSARLKVNKKLWPQATAVNIANLEGAGIGLNFLGVPWNAKSYLATAVGPKSSLISTNKVWRAWMEISRQF